MPDDNAAWVTERLSRLLNQAIYESQKSQEDDD